MIEALLLVAVVAFVPGSEGYTEWNISVSNNQFIAITDEGFFIALGYSPNQFTNQMLKLWEYEKLRQIL